MTVFWTNDLFCGAGGMGLGFKNAGFRLAGAWDFDKYAVESYGNNVSPKVKQADITQMKWDDLPKANVWTFGFPCQDLSIAGKQAGLFEGKRSGLFFEVMRLLDETIENDVEQLPDVIMAENVKGLKPYLQVLKDEYKKRGYRMTYTLYNSKYWGVPQNRERYFVVGIREKIRKAFQFPRQQTDFVPKLSSVLETDVDEKYYIDDLKAAKIIEQAMKRIELKGTHPCITPDRVDKRQNGRRAKGNEEEMYTLTAQDLHGVIQSQPKIEMLGLLDMKGNETVRRVYDPEGLSPTLTTSEGGHRQPKILEACRLSNQATKFEGFTDVAGTLLARDYKGFGNQEMTGVLEIGYVQEGNSDKTLQVLRSSDGTEETQERGIDESPTLQQTGLLQSGMHEESVRRGESQAGRMECIAQKSNEDKESGNVRDLRQLEECGNTPQGRELAEQQSRESSSSLSELSHENTQTEKEMQNLRQTTQGTGLLRETLCEVQETWGSELYNIQQYRVRKLTPREYSRLQGFPDSYKQVVSNSQFYKQMGNAVTVNVAQAIAENIKKFLEAVYQ